MAGLLTRFLPESLPIPNNGTVAKIFKEFQRSLQQRELSGTFTRFPIMARRQSIALHTITRQK